MHLCFVIIGATTTLLGVVLPALAGKFNFSDEQSARLFVFHAIGALLGTFVSEKLWTRIGFFAAIALGLFASAIGVAGIELFPAGLIALPIFLNGCGVGLTIPAINLLVTKIEPARTAAALNLLNFSWSVGALASPIVFAAFSERSSIRFPLFCLAALLILFASLFWWSRQPNIHAQTVESATAAESSAFKFWTHKNHVLTWLFFFVYLGAENGLGGWLSSYALRLQTDSEILWTPVLTVFWLAFLLGRLFAPLFLRVFSDELFLRLNSVLAFGGMILLLFGGANWLFVAAPLTAFGLAPIFPTALAQFTKRTGAVGARQAKWLFVGSTLGGTFVTWLVGVIAAQTNNLANGLFVVLICCALLTALRLIDNEKLIIDN